MLVASKVTYTKYSVKCDKCECSIGQFDNGYDAESSAKNQRWYVDLHVDFQKALCYSCQIEIIKKWYEAQVPLLKEDSYDS